MGSKALHCCAVYRELDCFEWSPLNTEHRMVVINSSDAMTKGDTKGMVQEILDSLDDLKLSDQVGDEAKVMEMVEQGTASKAFIQLVATVANELALLYDLDERISAGDCNAENFLFEISSLLSEFGCPYAFLTDGDVSSRFQNPSHCLTLLLFLLSELQAAKMHFFNNPPVLQKSIGTDEFNLLKNICITLKMAKPPDNIDASKFMTGIEKKIQEYVSQCPPEHLSTPVIKQKLGPVHWEKLAFLNEALIQEYETRRSMLLKRLDVTIVSFNWSERAKKNLDGAASAYQEKRNPLKAKSSISISHLLAAREDISVISKTSSGTTRTSCAIKKVVMGKVPDRGGRTDEINAPLPEMPSWQKRSTGGQGDQRPGTGGYRGGGRGGRGGGHRGGRGGGFGDRPASAGGRRGGGNWGRGRGHQQAGSGTFERAFSHGGQNVSKGGFASGRHDYRS